MSHSAAASLSPIQTPGRRRGRGASVSTMAVDSRYRSAVARRQNRARPAPAYVEDQWPNWIVPSALVSVMTAISIYHADALLAAVLKLV